MEILVFSDSHGDFLRMKKVIDSSRAEVVVHLGDGSRDFEALAEQDTGRIYLGVRGNCDLMAGDIPVERMIELGGVRILCLHGHSHFVKQGTGLLERYAREKGADAVLYGHTHICDNRYLPEEDGMAPLYIMNPGSIGRGYRASFGHISISDGKLLLNVTEYKY